jgi:hypothetical protein
MSRDVSFSYAFPAPPDAFVALMHQRSFVQERLSSLNGGSAELLGHELTEDGGVVTVVSTTVSRTLLPVALRGFVLGSPSFRRTETWSPVDGGYDGDVQVVLDGVPSDIAGRLELRAAAGGSALTGTWHVSIPVPVVRGTLERTVAGHIAQLADVEVRYALDRVTV